MTRPHSASGDVGRSVRRFRRGAWTAAADALAAEEPLEIRLRWETPAGLAQKSIAITMRTPGNDFELAAGFLHGEGIISGAADVLDVAYCLDEGDEQAFNIVSVTLRPDLRFDLERLERHFYTTSSCGVCGKATLEALEVQGCAALPEGPVVEAAVLCALPEALRHAQAVFDRTGGLHAAGLFDLEGRLLSLREDVGRHNALDKLIGEAVLAGRTPLAGQIVLLSGRASFELMQKAAVARVPIVAAVGAPSSLAAEVAQTFNLTLVGFLRPDGFNLYGGGERIRG